MKQVAIVAVLMVVALAVYATGTEEVSEAAATETVDAGMVIPDLGQDTFWTLSDYERASGKQITQFGEAPEFREMVAAGTLPPVEERLPEEPLVLLPQTPVKTTGTYGGILRSNTFSSHINSGDQTLYRGEHSYTANVYPNVAQNKASSEDGRVWTYTLRKGHKWSDGEPVTTEDIMFFYEDIALNKEIYPDLWYRLQQPSGNPRQFVRIDDYTFKIVSEAPFLIEEDEDMATATTFYPKHYLKQFHPTYQDRATLDGMVKEAGFDSWVQLIDAKADWWQQLKNPDKPVLAPWRLIQGPPAKTRILTRNPYFHAIDAAGNQLPYLAELHIEEIADETVARLKMISGESDWFLLRGGFDFIPVAMEAEEQGKVAVTRWPFVYLNANELDFNLTIADPALRQVFRNKDFRFGASHAINREQINQLVYFGMQEPSQACYSSDSPFYNERLCKTAIEYDPAQANRLLDQAGLDKRDSEGWRLRPDGKRMEINLISRTTPGTAKAAEIITDNFKAVGLFTNLRVMEGAIISEMRKSNTLEAVLNDHAPWSAEGAYWIASPIGIPMPGSHWAPLWYEWTSSGGRKGEEPPPEVLRAIEAHEKVKTMVDLEERTKYMKIVTDIAADNLWLIGTLTRTGFLVLYNPRLHNVATGYRAYVRGTYGRPEVWYYGE